MIKKNHLFVLGAGTSIPYGFPSGSELVRNIIDYTSKGKLIYMYLKWLGYDEREVSRFSQDLEKSGMISIDTFLEYRNDYLEMGKVILTLTISIFEYKSTLYSGNPANNLYGYIFNKMITEPEKFSDNKISFITFNYDRSLEYFFINALRSGFNLKTREAANILKRIPIIHAHGKIGYLKDEVNSRELWDRENPYGVNIKILLEKEETFLNLGRISDMINIIHEGEADNSIKERIENEISKSELITFLGFGYNYMNLKKLGFSNGNELGHISIKGTTYGLTKKEILHHQSFLLNFANKVQLDKNNFTSLEYLREKVMLNPSQ